MKNIGFIGTGNIARSLISGMVAKGVDVSKVFVSGRDGEAWPKSKERLKEEYGVSCAINNIDLVEKCDVIVIALEPKVYKHVIPEIKDSVRPEQIFISLAPNYSTDEISELFEKEVKIARAMPNTPAAVGEAMVGVAFAVDRFEQDEKQVVVDFFEKIGRAEVLQEKYIDMIPAMSGSAPAYMYLLVEAMADAGVLIGFSRKMSYSFASQVLVGAGKMIQETGMHPCELKDMICSPGGTTVEAIKMLEKNNFRNDVISAMLACYDKSNNLK